MRQAFIILTASYVLSQFYRAFLAVLTLDLERDLGATATVLSQASAIWFLTFALMQLPIGWALDRIGPRITASVIFAIGGASGAFLFAAAQAPWHITAAMGLIGIGCSPVLMAAYYLIARHYPGAAFAGPAAIVIGVGSLGNLGAALPMTLLVEAAGWRMALVLIGIAALVIAGLIWLLVKDPPAAEARVAGKGNGSLIDLLKIPALWLIFPLVSVNYAAAAGIRGLWIGPYLGDVFASDAAQIGMATLIMGLVMTIGVFIYGPLDRIFGTRKWVILTGNLIGGLACLLLWQFGAGSLWGSIALMSIIGIAGGSFPVLVAHCRSFFPAHLMGRGVTLVNLFGIGGVGIFQSLSGRIYAANATGPVTAGYEALWLFFALLICAGCCVYLFSQDRVD